MSTTWLFLAERDYPYNHDINETFTALTLARSANLSAEHGLVFLNKRYRADGTVRYDLYHRFPIGAFALIKLAIVPFKGDFAAQIAAARSLMLVFFCAAAVLAYLALARLAASRAVALGATLLAFSSYHMLDYSDTVSTEKSVDLFAVMLVFHGMVLFQLDGGRRRFWQLAGRVAVALLLGWRVYALLLPFLVFGAAQEAALAWRSHAGAASTFASRVGAAAAGVLRGRSALLGALALLFGLGVLGYNIAQEHAVFDGQRAVADLPSVRSILQRGGFADAGYSDAVELEWRHFLVRQFHRVGVMCAPFAVSGGVEWDERAWRAWTPWFVWLGLLATVGALAGVAVFRGARSPSRAPPAAPAALALTGFCWAFLVPGNVAWDYHQFETLFHVGVPLCLFAAALAGVRRLCGPQAAAFCAAASAVVFAASSVALGLRHADDEARTRYRALLGEFDAIAKEIQEKAVWMPAYPNAQRVMKVHAMVDFVAAGSFVHYAKTPEVAVPKAPGVRDFVLTFERHDVPALRTPNHRFVFLYQSEANDDILFDSMRRARRREHRLLQARVPVARVRWERETDLHVVRRGTGEGESAELVYLTAPCDVEATKGRFHLRLVPVDAELPVRERLDFERRDYIFFDRHGVVSEQVCLMRVALPAWPVANVYTGQWHPGGEAASWRVAFRLDTDRLREALGALRDEPPTARGAFDLHWRGSRLAYVRAPCAQEDVRRRFFLHVVPQAVSSLPLARRASGFQNLDFEFGEHGARFDDACVATLPLPDYDIAHMRTGQFDLGAGVAWQVELAADRRFDSDDPSAAL